MGGGRWALVEQSLSIGINETENSTILLSFWTCFFLDSEDGNYTTINPGQVLHCPLQGRYLLGPIYGDIITVILSFLIYLFGSIGCVGNALNVILLPRSMRRTGVSLKLLLIILAICEFFTSISATGGTIAMMLTLENYSRTYATLECLRILDSACLLCASSSVFLTILLSAERYIVITYPVRASSWLTPTKSKLYIVGMLLIPLSLSVPWVASQMVKENPYAELSPNSSVADFPYIIESTDFMEKIYMPTLMVPILILELGIPIPVLLMFNGLLYFSIRKYTMKQTSLCSRQRRELNAARMIRSLAVFLLIGNIPLTFSSFAMIFEAATHVFHRELVMFQGLCVVLCASINFFVYYWFVCDFRSELKRLFWCIPWKVPPPPRSARRQSSVKRYDLRRFSCKYTAYHSHSTDFDT